MQSRGSYGFKNNLNVYIYYIYMVYTRVEPAIFEKREDSRRGSRGGVCSGRGDPDPPPPPPLELSKYTSQRTTFQDFRRYQGVTLYAYLKFFGSLRSPVITSSSNERTCTMIRHYRSTILQIALEISWLCIVHILSTPVQNNYVVLLFVKPPDIYSSTLQLKWKCQSTNVCTKHLQNSFKFSSFL